jgi:porin
MSSMSSYDRALHLLRAWLDSWAGIGHVAVGMHRQGYGLKLTQYDDRGWLSYARRRTVLALLALSVALAVRVAAQEPPGPLQEVAAAVERPQRCSTPANPHRLYFECVGQQIDFSAETLTKDVAGFRSELRTLGITPTASYTAQFLGNPSGGQSRGFTYAGTFQASITWDASKVLPTPGLSFNVGAAWSTGRSLSADYIGNVFSVQSAYTVPNGGTNDVTLGPLYLQQLLLEDSLTLAVGRLAPASTFATLPVFNNYINGAINANPGSLGVNDSSFTSYPPGVEWGAQGIYYLTARLQVAAGIFNTNPEAAAGADRGHNFAFRNGNSGVLSILQATYLFNHTTGDPGLPGLYTIGGFYDGNDFTNLARPGTTERGSYSVYAMLQQMVYREGGPRSRKGLTMWGEATLAPRSSVSTLSFLVGGGLSYRGLIPGRGADIASLAAISGSFSRHVPRATAETVIEANYQIAVRGWLSITPDLQYVILPGGSSAVGNAFVLGTQVAISF